MVGLFAASWLMRGAADDPPVLGLVLSLAGGGLALVTGWLVGELVGRLGVDDGAHLDAPSSLSGPVRPSRTAPGPFAVGG